MQYLTPQDILVMHALIIDEIGGSHGVRDVGLLRSLVMRPQLIVGSTDAFPDIFSKAACYFESLARYHVFVDGNKRTALAATVRFLVQNDYAFMATNAQAEKYTLEVVLKRHDIQHIAAWLRLHSKKLARTHRKLQNP